jgi:hypothetical protein
VLRSLANCNGFMMTFTSSTGVERQLGPNRLQFSAVRPAVWRVARAGRKVFRLLRAGSFFLLFSFFNRVSTLSTEYLFIYYNSLFILQRPEQRDGRQTVVPFLREGVLGRSPKHARTSKYTNSRE